MSVLVAEKRLLRVDDLDGSEIPEKFAEIIEGELIQTAPPGRYHNRIASRFTFLFSDFCESRSDFTFGTDNEGFLIGRDPDSLLSPDGCLFRRRPEPEGTWMEFAPEVVVEVLSPSNSPLEMAFKRRKYFAAGTEQFWIADPESKTLEIHFKDGRLLTAQEPDIVMGEGIVQGMEVRLEEIFRKP
jgi:Uma2 family endonuclease